MKFKAIEAMLRVQYDIPASVDVSVTLLTSYNSSYTFISEWWDGMILNKSKISLIIDCLELEDVPF